jgi:hypothetical protein
VACRGVVDVWYFGSHCYTVDGGSSFPELFWISTTLRIVAFQNIHRHSHRNENFNSFPVILYVSTYYTALQRNLTCSPALNIEYSESYMKLTAYVSRSSLLKSVRTAVRVKRKWTVGGEVREDSVVFRCQQYRSIFTKVLGRVDYMLFVTKHTMGLIEMRPPVTATDTPMFLRKTVALTWNIAFLFRDKHEYTHFFHRSESL